MQRIKCSASSSYSKDNEHSVSLSINDQNTTASLTIDNFVRIYNAKEMYGNVTLYLKENGILTVWFNAWKYERENQYASVALMKTIADAMGELPMYQEVKKVLLRG
jgi:hypothetical protein